MGFFKKLTQTVIDVVVLPVNVALDVTMITPALEERSGTVDRLKALVKHAKETYESLDE